MLEEPKGVVSGSHGRGYIVHLHEGCPYYPEDPRPTTDGDVRKGRSRVCSWCDSHGEGEQAIL